MRPAILQITIDIIDLSCRRCRLLRRWSGLSRRAKVIGTGQGIQEQEIVENLAELEQLCP